MKFIINIPTEKVKSIAATAAMMSGETLPAELVGEIEATSEVDITEDLESDPDTKMAIQAFALMAVGKIIEKCEAKAEAAQAKVAQQ